MNVNFFSPGFESNSIFYNPDWCNHFDFSWQAQAIRNCTSQFLELHHPKYSQFKNQVLHPSPYDSLPQKSSLDDTLKECMERIGQSTIQVSQPKLSLEDMLREFMEISSQSTIQVPQPDLSLEDTLKECMERIGQSTVHVPQPESSLEDTIEAFIHSNNKTMQELKNVTMIDSPMMPLWLTLQ
jgi:phage gp16-like protein